MNNSADRLTSTKNNVNEQIYLRIQIDRDIAAAIPMEYAREVLVIPNKRLTPIPNMSPCVLGLLNQRSKVFWVVDLPQILELTQQKKYSQQYHIAIVRVNDIPLGLAVDRVKGSIRLDPNGIRSPLETIPLHLIPYVQGCFALKTEVLLILNLQAIINSPLLQDNKY